MTENNEEKPRLLTRQEKLEVLKEMIDSYEKLPQGALAGFVTHYDFCSLLVLIESLFKDS